MLDKDIYCIHHHATVKDGLSKINDMNGDAIFVINDDQHVLGTITDGDIRRGFLNGITLSDSVSEVMNQNFKHLKQDEFTLEMVDELRKSKIDLIPIIDSEGKLQKILNFKSKRSILPVQVMLMAGGRGERLRPMTDTLPKPLLPVGNKPIIEHNIDRLALYGIENIAISVKYKAELIEDYFKDGAEKGLNISYIHEKEALGTIGAVSFMPEVTSKSLLVMNSDLLTNINYEDFYRFFVNNDADMVVCSIPYRVDIPYGVLEMDGNNITSLKEKPSYTYYSNGGIYLIKATLLNRIPKDTFYNATDLMEDLIQDGKKVLNYPITQYWLDIGKPQDYEKAKEDIKHIQW